MYDVIIIGAGVSGAAAARELSRYNAKICVIEKEEDVCCGTSKANSAIVHAGYDAKEGSLMAKLNVRGNAMMEQLSKELDFHLVEVSGGEAQRVLFPDFRFFAVGCMRWSRILRMISAQHCMRQAPGSCVRST